MKCEKCGKDFEYKAEKGITYKGIDYHHNPPEFMLEKWAGEIIPLCRKDHVKLHKKIKEIMFKHSTCLKMINSEHWLWLKTLPMNREGCIKEVIEFTKGWIKEND